MLLSKSHIFVLAAASVPHSQTGQAGVIVHSTHPSKGSAQIPGELAQLLGVGREDLARATKPTRAVYFLKAGPRALRVVGARKDADLGAQAMAADRVVAKATLSKSMISNVAQAVYRHLEMRTYEVKPNYPPGTDDQIAWAMEEGEYFALRRGLPLPDPHLVMLNACVGSVLPTLATLEGRGRGSAGPL